MKFGQTLTGKKVTTHTKKKLAQQAMLILKQLEAVKPLYSELDKLTLMLKDTDLTHYGLAVIDNYEEKNTAFRVTAIRRFELKRIK